ncbi:MAG TPA: hypothetical protein VIP98_16345 [Microlunatus sp.]
MPTLAPEARPLGPDAAGQWVRRWLSPSWTQVVDTWVTCRLAEQNRQITGDPVTFRARFWSVVRCYPTGEGLVWFKEANPGHHFEAGLTAAMARLAPDHIVVPIAVDPGHGRLLTNDHGTTLDHADVEDQPTRRMVVGELARLQCTLLGRISAEEHPGLLALPPATVGERVRTVIREWATLPSDHPLHTGPGLQEQAGRAADVLDQCTASISDLVPVDLETNDVYPANICADRSASRLRLRFFDFGNAVWGHPFVTLHGFLDAVEEWNEAPLSSADREALYDEYIAVWSEHLHADPQLLRSDLTSTRILVYPHRLLSWLRLVPHADPIELRTRAEIPRRWMATVAELAD